MNNEVNEKMAEFCSMFGVYPKLEKTEMIVRAWLRRAQEIYKEREQFYFDLLERITEDSSLEDLQALKDALDASRTASREFVEIVATAKSYYPDIS